MKLGDVLKKERERKKLTVADISGQLRIMADAYRDIEAGHSSAEEWGPLLALIAVKLKTPISRPLRGKHRFEN
jgi:transcriptional regulator with XRE-family HTH domain